ncbi:MAG: N-6 DNA methylase, partial [Chloroflexi bacterium]|nr:N-6 DNA methylase [Chloroflexota bacterium]
MPFNYSEIEARLWAAADELRANSKLKSSEYSVPVLGLIFLRYAEHKFAKAEREFAVETRPGVETRHGESLQGRRRTIGKADYQARGVMYLPPEARFPALLNLPQGANIGKAINEAMKAIEAENEELRDVLPRTYNRLENDLLVTLLKNLNSVPMDIEGDAFGKIYEYFLGKFAMSEGQKGGEFFTPTLLVDLIVAVIAPYHGRLFDPANGAGGMFVQSAHFVERRRKNPMDEIAIYGQEKVAETVRLCKMNLAVHGLSGDIRQSNTYYEDIHNCVGKFDFVMANPPFNVDKVDKERLQDDRRFPFGLPRADNANYVWIQLFYSALNRTGRAGFVMANSASDARQSELEIRRQLIQAGAVDVMIAIGPNFFYTVTLPCTLWFLDKGKAVETPRRDTVLFIDARHIYRQVDRAHREFTPKQIEFIAGLVRLYRGEDLKGYAFDPDGLNLTPDQTKNLKSAIKNQKYADV